MRLIFSKSARSLERLVYLGLDVLAGGGVGDQGLICLQVFALLFGPGFQGVEVRDDQGADRAGVVAEQDDFGQQRGCA